MSRVAKIRLHNITSQAKPLGVAGAMVFTYVGAEPPAVIAQWRLEGQVTRMTFEKEFDAAVAPGSLVWFSAYWYYPRGQNGPVSTPISTNTQFGGISHAA